MIKKMQLLLLPILTFVPVPSPGPSNVLYPRESLILNEYLEEEPPLLLDILQYDAAPPEPLFDDIVWEMETISYETEKVQNRMDNIDLDIMSLQRAVANLGKIFEASNTMKLSSSTKSISDYFQVQANVLLFVMLILIIILFSTRKRGVRVAYIDSDYEKKALDDTIIRV